MKKFIIFLSVATASYFAFHKYAEISESKALWSQITDSLED